MLESSRVRYILQLAIFYLTKCEDLRRSTSTIALNLGAYIWEKSELYV